ncbi:MAG: FG-GAP repeat domain-containing protein [Bacteriovoracia bacterium]
MILKLKVITLLLLLLFTGCKSYLNANLNKIKPTPTPAPAIPSFTIEKAKGNDTTPSFTLTAMNVGDVIKIYSASSGVDEICSNGVLRAETTATSSSVTVEISTPLFGADIYEFRYTTTTNGVESECSSLNQLYDFENEKPTQPQFTTWPTPNYGTDTTLDVTVGWDGDDIFTDVSSIRILQGETCDSATTFLEVEHDGSMSKNLTLTLPSDQRYKFIPVAVDDHGNVSTCAETPYLKEYNLDRVIFNPEIALSTPLTSPSANTRPNFRITYSSPSVGDIISIYQTSNSGDVCNDGASTLVEQHTVASTSETIKDILLSSANALTIDGTYYYWVKATDSVDNDSCPSHTSSISYEYNSGLNHGVTALGNISSAGTNDIALADIDGVNGLDLLVANSSGPSTLWLNNGDGTFTENTTRWDVVNKRGISIKMADVNSDTNLDIIFVRLNTVPDPDEYDVKIWLNDGTGNFSDLNSEIAGIASATSAFGKIEIADLDGDNLPDIIVPHKTNNQISYCINQGGPPYYNTCNTIAINGATSVAAGDLNNDGDADLAVVSYSANYESAILWNQGGGSFLTTDKTTLGNFAGNEIKITPTSLDGDSYPDVVAAINGQNQMWLTNGNIDKTFSSTSFGSSSINSMGLSVAKTENVLTATGVLQESSLDANGDGRSDVIFANVGFNQVWLNGIFNTTSARLIDAGLEVGSTASYSIIAADLNSGSNLEYIFSNPSIDNNIYSNSW